MPKVRTDWRELLVDAMESTVGWSLEMHLRTPVGLGGATPATLKLSTAAGTLLVGIDTEHGTGFGISTNVPKASMNMATGRYVADIKRIDGGRDEDLIGTLDLVFEPPITETGVA